MRVPIVLYGNPVLRAESEEVREFGDEVRGLAADMLDTMRDAGGVGLAAPQVDQSIRIIVIEAIPEEGREEAVVLVNPRVVGGEGEATMEEGCLSMPDIRADVTRPEEVVVEAQDLDGQTVSYEADGMFARVLQHEIDHLDGVLFIDRIPLERREFLRNRLRRLAEDASRGKTA